MRYNILAVKNTFIISKLSSRTLKLSQNDRPKADFVAREAAMGKYIGYFLIILVIIFALEYFQIIDIPYFDIPDLQTKGEQIKSKSEDNMNRRFGD